MKKLSIYSLLSNKFKNSLMQLSQSRIALETSKILMKIGIGKWTNELTDLNPFSSRLLQRITLSYHNRTHHSQTNWTITPAIKQTADFHQALTFQEFTDNLIEYKRINELRWNDELIKSITQ